ncbi:MAG: RNA polymerase subunit sigma-70, partial [Gammaproteobacteria bacterium]|nr:RNA polymerase subunit sigma-70 [Gammaproteobacteria bacterium]
MSKPLSSNTQSLAHLKIEGGGQIVVQGDYAYIGHMKPPQGTSIVDISDPRKPRITARLESSPWSHTHKVRVCGDIMVTNVEQDRRHFLRRQTQRLTEVRQQLTVSLAREPEASELAKALDISLGDLSDIEAAIQRGYEEGGF